MSQHANQANAYNDSSVLVAMGAYAGSLFATITNSDMAAWTTLVATVGTLSYQFFKIWLENRKKNFLIEFRASMDIAKAEMEALIAEKTEIQRRCDQMERDKNHYSEWVEQLLHKEDHEDDQAV
jgi:flavodoxin